MTLKYIDFSVDMYGTTAISSSTYPVVYTGDESSVNVRFTLTDEPDLVGATAKAHFYFADSHHIERDLTLDGLVFNYTLVGTENDHAGIARTDIMITLDGATFTRAGYKFRVDTSLEASAPLVDYAVDTLDTLVDTTEDWLLQAQSDFGTAQAQRADEWVTDNDTRDDAFDAAQSSRATTFNESEAARTSTFNTNETSRSNTFTTNENARQAAAEANQAQAATDHTTAVADNATAIADSSRAASDHATATTDHSTAVTDHSTASADHTAALADQEIVDGLQDQFDAVIANATVDSEVINARQGSATLSQNLLSIKSELAEKASESDLIDTRQEINNIIISNDLNPEKDAELVSARFGAETLAEKISASDNIIRSQGRLKSDLYKFNNLIDGVKILENKYASIVDGSIKDGPSKDGYDATTGFIEVFSGFLYHNKTATVRCFTKGFTYIGGLGTGPDEVFRERELPEGTELIRVNFKLSELSNLYVMEKKTMYTDSGILNIQKIDSPKKERVPTHTNMVDVSDFTIGKYINSNGFLDNGPSLSGFNSISMPIKVKPETEYYNYWGVGTVYNFYDINGEHIQGVNTPSKSITTPQNCEYLVISLIPSNINNYIFVELKYPQIFDINIKHKYSSDMVGSKISFSDIIQDIKNGHLDAITSAISVEYENEFDVIKLGNAEYTQTRHFVKMFKVRPLTNVVIDLLAKASEVGRDIASMQMRFFKNGERVDPLYSHRYDLTETRFKTYKYRYVVPREADEARLVIYVRDGNTITFRNLEISVETNHDAIDSGIRFIGHRTLMQLSPENTMAGLELAKQAGMWGTVINMNATSDGVLVSLHDRDISRTSNGTGLIDEMTFAQARQYDYGSHFSKYYTNEPIPLLEDMLKFCATSGIHPVIRIAHEITDDSNGYLTDIYTLIKKYGLINKCSVKGFEYNTLVNLYAIAGKSVRYGWSGGLLTQENIDMMRIFQDDRYQGAFLDVESPLVTKEGMDLAISNNMPVSSWIVNDFNTAYLLIKMGVSEITTGSLTLQNCQF